MRRAPLGVAQGRAKERDELDGDQQSRDRSEPGRRADHVSKPAAPPTNATPASWASAPTATARTTSRRGGAPRRERRGEHAVDGDLTARHSCRGEIDAWRVDEQRAIVGSLDDRP